MKIAKTLIAFTDLKENIFRCVGDTFKVTEERAEQLLNYEGMQLVEIIDDIQEETTEEETIEEENTEEEPKKKGAKKNGK